MNVSLTPHLEKMIHRKIKTGRYQSASEVVREALRLLHDRDTKLDELRKEIQIGIDQLDRGEGKVFSSRTLRHFIEEVKRKGRKRLAEQRKRLRA